MRFLFAWLIMVCAGLHADATISVGWALFIMLWKVIDLIDERMPIKHDNEGEVNQ